MFPTAMVVARAKEHGKTLAHKSLPYFSLFHLRDRQSRQGRSIPQKSSFTAPCATLTGVTTVRLWKIEIGLYWK